MNVNLVASSPPRFDRPCRHQFGFGLIESAVTLLVISIGLLAVAYLQTLTQRHGHDSAARTQATLIAAELMDRIRISGIRASDSGANAFTGPPPDALPCESARVQAENDRNCFYNRIRERLPFGAGAIEITTDTPRLYRITVAWLDRDARRLDKAGSGLDEAECSAAGRLWYTGPVSLIRTSSKLPVPACLFRQQWTLVQ